MNIVIGIQARSGSTRLHHKSLQKIGQKAIIDHCVEACRLTGLPVYVLPPVDDGFMRTHCFKHNYLWHVAEAAESNVLSRYVALQAATGADAVVRITGDCPFPLVPMLTWCAATATLYRSDFVTNVQPPRTMPDGWDVEVMSARMLQWLDKVSKPEDREHVTAAAYREGGALWDPHLAIVRLNYPLDLSNIKISVDTQEDLDRVREMYRGQE